MFEIDLPSEPSSVCLDAYLENGWFRSAGLMTRTPLLPIADEVRATVPTRVKLDGYAYPKGMRRVLRRNEGRLRSEVGVPRIDAAREALYRATQVRFVGYQVDTLAELLETGPLGELFETREVAVWDGDELVAASYFDVGKESIASLVAVYDQARKREGLGTYTMLLEIAAALEEGCRFYYPGYVLIGDPWLDYKLRLGNVQYRTHSGRWRSARALPRRDPGRDRLYQRISAAETALVRAGIHGRRRIYPLFWLEETGIAWNHGFATVSSPLVIEVAGDVLETGAWLVDYRQRSDTYIVCRAQICEALRELTEGGWTADAKSRNYAGAPLMRNGVSLETRSATQAARWLSSFVTRG